MTYKIFIQTGKGKNYASMGSTPLKNKQAVVNWIKKCPLGNRNTYLEIKNLKTKQAIYDTKGKFFRIKGIKFKKV